MGEPTSTTIAVGVASLSFTLKILMLGVCVLLGANAHAIVLYQSAKQTKAAYGKLDYFLNFFGGLFGGCLFTIMAIYATSSDLLIIAAGGLGAFLGYKGIRQLGNLLFHTMESHIK